MSTLATNTPRYRALRTRIGRRIREARQHKGWAQWELAGHLGTARNEVSRWELGKASPSTPTLYALCETLDVSADYLLGREQGEDR